MAILLETSELQAKEVAEWVLNAMRSYEHIVQGRRQKITASIGLVSFPKFKAKTTKVSSQTEGSNQVYVYGTG